MDEPEWKPVSWAPDYEVSDEGGVRRADTWSLLRPGYSSSGRLMLKIYTGGKPNVCLVHRLVAEAFLPDWNPNHTVEFYNGDITDCAVSNLYMTDRRVAQNRSTR